MPHRFKCSKCDEWHEGFPDLGYKEPKYAGDVPEAERAKRVYLTSDLCVLDDEFFFVRCLLPLPVRGTGDSFSWGVWSSLSKSNFVRYQKNFDTDMSDWEPMFGYLSNSLPNYPETLGLKLSVQTRGGGIRPIVTLEPTDHPLAIEQRDGIAFEAVLKIVEPYLGQ